MKYKETLVAQGGLMRCDVESVYDHIDAHAEEDVPEEPLTITCKYKPHTEIRLEDGTWRWVNSYEPIRPFTDDPDER